MRQAPSSCSRLGSPAGGRVGGSGRLRVLPTHGGRVAGRLAGACVPGAAGCLGRRDRQARARAEPGRGGGRCYAARGGRRRPREGRRAATVFAGACPRDSRGDPGARPLRGERHGHARPRERRGRGGRGAAVGEAGARARMVNAFLAGLGSVTRLREYGLPVFVHRVGSAFLRRGGPVSVSARVLAELTRLLGADYVQVGSFSPRTFDTDDEVPEQIAAARPATAVIGGGVGAENAREQLERAGTRDGVILLLGSAAYAHPSGARAGVAAAVEAIG